MPKTKQRPFTKGESVVAGIGVVGFFLSFVTLLVLHGVAVHGPLSPDPVHGLVMPYNNHGVIHYITNELSIWIDRLFWGAAGFFLCVLGPAAKAQVS